MSTTVYPKVYPKKILNVAVVPNASQPQAFSTGGIDSSELVELRQVLDYKDEVAFAICELFSWTAGT
jgi:hypothetical protein